MKKLVITIILCSLFFGSCDKNTADTGNKEETSIQPNTTSITTKKEKKEVNYPVSENKAKTNTIKPNSINGQLKTNFSLGILKWKDVTFQGREVHYPEIYGFSNLSIQKKLNIAIYSFISNHVEEVVNADNEEGDITKGDSKTILNTTFKVHYNKNNLFSIRFYHSDNFGGAHPGSLVESLTLSVKTGNKIKLDDLFLPEFNYITVSNDYIAENLIPALDNELFRDFEGIKDKEAYYLTNNGLVFYFQTYDYTPYAYGPLEFTIPYSKYSNLKDKL